MKIKTMAPGLSIRILDKDGAFVSRRGLQHHGVTRAVRCQRLLGDQVGKGVLRVGPEGLIAKLRTGKKPKRNESVTRWGVGLKKKH